MIIQSVAEWKKSVQANTPISSGVVQSVAEWKAQQQTSSQVAPAPPSSPQNIFNKVQDYGNSLAQTPIDFGNAILHPLDTLKKLPGEFIRPFQAGIKKASTPLPDGNFVTDTANLISGVSESLFSPITGVFNIAQHIPGLKSVADALAIPPTLIGLAGSYTSGKAIDWIPDAIVSQETKDIIKAPIQEAASIVGQVTLGGKILGKVSEHIKSGKAVTPKVAKSIIKDAQREVKLQVKSDAKNTSNPVILSVKDWKAQGKPTIATSKVADNITPNVLTPKVIDNTTSKVVTSPEIIAPKKITAPDVTFKSTESTFGLAKTLKTKAIKDKMIFGFDKRFRDLPVGEKRIKKEDMAKVTEFTLNNPNEAFKVAMGEKRPPADMLASDILVSVVEYAKNTNNIEAIVKLTNESKLNESFRRAGQEIQGLAQLNPAAKKLGQVKKAREDKVVNYTKKKRIVNNTIKQETKKVNLSKSDLNWGKFLNEITC